MRNLQTPASTVELKICGGINPEGGTKKGALDEAPIWLPFNSWGDS